MKHVVVIGGGTGTFTVLSALKKYPLHLSAVVSMADDGGSTGILRDELGVLPPGDIRQCLVALSKSDRYMRKLMNYRFSNGGLKGHSFGNLFLSALEKTTGSFDKAVEKASEVLRLEGEVIPATLDKVQLVAYLKNGKAIRGQSKIHNSNLRELRKMALKPQARANPKAVAAIREANLVVIAPGDVYSSLIPNLLVSSISRAIARTKAKKVYVCNLMTKEGHTDGYTVADFVSLIERNVKSKLDYVIVNKEKPSAQILKLYAREGEHTVKNGRFRNGKYILENLINKKFPKPQKGDSVKRTLIRHDPEKLGQIIAGILGKTGE
ncbi:MAG: YvcK family protein [Candidatus Liptonbacteria bacterium]|nr:YvcK family protein [Candidatus Liptonbacteria bacterium]